MKTELKRGKTPKDAGYYLWQDPDKPESQPTLALLVKVETRLDCDFYCLCGGRGYFIHRDAVGMWSEKQDIYED